jgi:hypothetical protein
MREAWPARHGRGHSIRRDFLRAGLVAVRAPRPPNASGHRTNYGSHRSLEEREATALGVYCMRGDRFRGGPPSVSRGWDCVEELRHSSHTHPRRKGHADGLAPATDDDASPNPTLRRAFRSRRRDPRVCARSNWRAGWFFFSTPGGLPGKGAPRLEGPPGLPKQTQDRRDLPEPKNVALIPMCAGVRASLAAGR